MFEAVLVLLGALFGLLIVALAVAAMLAKFGTDYAWEALRRGVVATWARLRGVRRLPLKFRKRLGGTGEVDGQHYCAFVSRHHLAEGGLECPLCKWKVAQAGDFSGVYVTDLDGRKNECLICPGEREVENGRREACQAILLASPDTEHGDHLNDKGEVDPYAPDPPEYFRFVRCRPDQAAREQWGESIRVAAEGELSAPGATPEELAASVPLVAAEKAHAERVRAEALAAGAPIEVAEALAIGARPEPKGTP